jgi:hypothetical protein
MGENQKNVLIGTAVLIVAMVLYPPFVCVHGGLITVASGYGWIWDLPGTPEREWSSSVPATVNVGTLAVQIVAALIVCALLFFAMKDQKKS